jgi:hypothetical protein
VLKCFLLSLLNDADVTGFLFPTENDRFEGTVCEGKPHGRGVCVYGDGRRCEGVFKRGRITGEGRVLWLDGATYTGTVDGMGVPNGRGVYTGKNGDRYEGEFVNGKKEGKGKILFSNGNEYEGEWAEDLIEGIGVYKWGNGDVYRGQFKKNIMEGKGTMNSEEGYTYVGEWAGDQTNGEGVITDPNGVVLYKGSWKDGVLYSA